MDRLRDRFHRATSPSLAAAAGPSTAAAAPHGASTASRAQALPVPPLPPGPPGSPRARVALPGKPHLTPALQTMLESPDDRVRLLADQVDLLDSQIRQRQQEIFDWAWESAQAISQAALATLEGSGRRVPSLAPVPAPGDPPEPPRVLTIGDFKPLGRATGAQADEEDNRPVQGDEHIGPAHNAAIQQAVLDLLRRHFPAQAGDFEARDLSHTAHEPRARTPSRSASERSSIASAAPVALAAAEPGQPPTPAELADRGAESHYLQHMSRWLAPEVNRTPEVCHAMLDDTARMPDAAVDHRQPRPEAIRQIDRDLFGSERPNSMRARVLARLAASIDCQVADYTTVLDRLAAAARALPNRREREAVMSELADKLADFAGSCSYGTAAEDPAVAAIAFEFIHGLWMEREGHDLLQQAAAGARDLRSRFPGIDTIVRGVELLATRVPPAGRDDAQASVDAMRAVFPKRAAVTV